MNFEIRQMFKLPYRTDGGAACRCISTAECFVLEELIIPTFGVGFFTYSLIIIITLFMHLFTLETFIIMDQVAYVCFLKAHYVLVF